MNHTIPSHIGQASELLMGTKPEPKRMKYTFKYYCHGEILYLPVSATSYKEAEKKFWSFVLGDIIIKDCEVEEL